MIRKEQPVESGEVADLQQLANTLATVPETLRRIVGDRTADDVDAIFPGQTAQELARFRAIRIGVFADRFRVKADIPHFRQ